MRRSSNEEIVRMAHAASAALFLAVVAGLWACGGSGGAKDPDAVADAGDRCTLDCAKADAGAEVGTLDVRGGPDGSAGCPVEPCGAVITIVNNAPVQEYIDPENPLDYYVQEDGNWVKFHPVHGCIAVCQDCEDFSCSGCYDMEAIPAGTSREVAWDGLMFGREGFKECESADGTISCFEQEGAPAGRYKVVLNYAWKWYSGTCMDDEYPGLSSPSAIELEFDYPLAAPPGLTITIPADTTQAPPWPPGESVTVLEHKLPSPRAGIAVAQRSDWSVWIVGGDTGTSTLAEVLSFNPEDGAEVEADLVLPVPVKAACAAWAEEADSMFVVGGMSANGPTDAIQKCDSSGCELLPTKLPGKRALPACFANDADRVFVLGGNSGTGGLVDQIASIDVFSGEVAVEPATLPTPRASRIGAVVGTDSVFFVGGLIQGGKTNEILALDPYAKEVTTLAAKLPMALDGGSYVWAGDRLVVLGGETLTAPTDAIVLISPDAAEDAVKPSDLKLPAPSRGTAAAVIDGAVYVFGGAGPTGLTSQIVRYVPGN